MIVDCHAHLVPPALLDLIRASKSRFPNVRQIESADGLALAFAGGKPTRPVSKPLSDIGGRIAWMDKQGIDRQVVGGWVDMFGYELQGEEGIAWSMAINEALLAAAKAEPRFVPLASVPLGDGKAAASVLKSAIAAGCRIVVLTNGCGGIRADFTPGQPVLINDHINLTATSPLRGATFVDLTDLYSERLRITARAVEPALAEGVYVQLPGPHYETPAEIRMLRTMGADLVGMSTALEAIAAREGGAEVLGISLVTNLAAGISGQPLDHAEVLATGRDSAARMGTLLRQLVELL